MKSRIFSGCMLVGCMALLSNMPDVKGQTKLPHGWDAFCYKDGVATGIIGSTKTTQCASTENCYGAVNPACQAMDNMCPGDETPSLGIKTIWNSPIGTDCVTLPSMETGSCYKCIGEGEVFHCGARRIYKDRLSYNPPFCDKPNCWSLATAGVGACRGMMFQENAE
jgi:hypothetical protein